MSNLVQCKACNKEIAKGVKKCPHCGKDQRNWFMRHKIISFFGVLIILIILAVAVIGGNDEGTKDSGSKDSSESDDKTDDKAEEKEEKAKAEEEKKKEDLESLEGDLKEKNKQVEVDKIKSQLLGYWFNPEHEYQVCNFEENHYICVTVASDEAYFEYVESYEVDAETGIITIKTEDGATFQVSIDGNMLNLNSIQYKKGSKEEVYGKVENFGGNPSELFDMEFYEDWEDL